MYIFLYLEMYVSKLVVQKSFAQNIYSKFEKFYCAKIQKPTIHNKLTIFFKSTAQSITNNSWFYGFVTTQIQDLDLRCIKVMLMLFCAIFGALGSKKLHLKIIKILDLTIFPCICRLMLKTHLGKNSFNWRNVLNWLFC